MARVMETLTTAWCVMCDVNSIDGPENPARMGAILTFGIISGFIAAITILAQGGGWFYAFAAYSGAGSLTVLATSALKVLHCRFLHARLSEPDSAPHHLKA